MTIESRFPTTVERLLSDHLPSVASVELLLALREAGSRPQGIDEVADAIGCPHTWAGRELERLRHRELAHGDGNGRYTFAARSRELGAATDELARLWYTNRRAVTRWLFAKQANRNRPSRR